MRTKLALEAFYEACNLQEISSAPVSYNPISGVHFYDPRLPANQTELRDAVDVWQQVHDAHTDAQMKLKMASSRYGPFHDVTMQHKDAVRRLGTMHDDAHDAAVQSARNFLSAKGKDPKTLGDHAIRSVAAAHMNTQGWEASAHGIHQVVSFMTRSSKPLSLTNRKYVWKGGKEHAPAIPHIRQVLDTHGLPGVLSHDVRRKTTDDDSREEHRLTIGTKDA